MYLMPTYVTNPPSAFLIFFFNATAPTEIYTLSLHDALPICPEGGDRILVHRPDREVHPPQALLRAQLGRVREVLDHEDRKSTRLNSSHANISYAVFCLKKKNKQTDEATTCVSPGILRTERPR